MYQVLFAEDELLVRLGLQNSIPWERFDMELVAQAGNGREAFELYKKLQPDVVITDIRMEGMDGYELIQRIRQLDSECSIIVISCLDDFETLRKMVSYQITGYILKASMSMEEIFTVLEKAKEHLEGIGRTGIKEGTKVESVEERLSKYLLEDEETIHFTEEGSIKQILLFDLAAEDRNKINELAMKFIHDLVRKQIPECLMVNTENEDFCLMLLKSYPNLQERIKQINHSIDSFLGVQFQITEGNRSMGDTLKNCYERILAQKREEREEEKSWDVIIQKAIQYMREHHQDTLSLAKISKVTGLSPCYFSHLFKKETGKNYIEFLNEIRLERVLKELRISDYKIVVVAENHGFRNLEHFSRFFKKCMGVSPAKWREQNR